MVRISCVLLSLRPQVYKYTRVGRDCVYFMLDDSSKLNESKKNYARAGRDFQLAYSLVTCHYYICYEHVNGLFLINYL